MTQGHNRKISEEKYLFYKIIPNFDSFMEKSHFWTPTQKIMAKISLKPRGFLLKTMCSSTHKFGLNSLKLVFPTPKNYKI